MHTSETALHYNCMDCKTTDLFDLTWGQTYIWNKIEYLSPGDYDTNLTLYIEAPISTTEPEILCSLSWLIERHESVRTYFIAGRDRLPKQGLSSSGIAAVQLVSCSVSDLDEVCKSIISEYLNQSFDLSVAVPARISIVTAPRMPKRIIIVFSHMICDAIGVQILREELMAHLSGDLVPGVSWHPRNQLEWENGPDGILTEDRALAFWRNTLPLLTRSVFGAPSKPPATPRWWNGALVSPALELILPTLAERYRVSTAAIVVTALALLICSRTGTTTFSAKLRVANRFAKETRRSVGMFAQEVPMLLDFRAAEGGVMLRNAHESMLIAARHGRASPIRVLEIAEHHGFRGECGVDIDCDINIIPSFSPAIRPTGKIDSLSLESEAKRTQFYWESKHERGYPKFFINAKLPSYISLIADTAYFPPEEIQKILRDVEAMLLDAALGREVFVHK